MNWLYYITTIPGKIMLIFKMLSEISARLRVIESKIDAPCSED